jgi:hypothetical protein
MLLGRRAWRVWALSSMPVVLSSALFFLVCFKWFWLVLKGAHQGAGG